MTYRDLLAVCDLEPAVMDFVKSRLRYTSKTGCRFIIVDAYNNEATIHYYLKNDFRFLVEDERLEAKYMGIGMGRLPLNTRLMYFDLLDMQPLPGYDEE